MFGRLRLSSVVPKGSWLCPAPPSLRRLEWPRQASKGLARPQCREAAASGASASLRSTQEPPMQGGILQHLPGLPSPQGNPSWLSSHMFFVTARPVSAGAKRGAQIPAVIIAAAVMEAARHPPPNGNCSRALEGLSARQGLWIIAIDACFGVRLK